MRTLSKKYIAIGLTVLSLVGCSGFDELNTNPDAAVKTSSSMLATGLILNITDVTIASGKSFLSPHFLSKSVIYTEFAEDLQYNYLGRTNYDGIPTLTNIEKMIAFAPTEPLKNSYTALGKFIRSWKFFDLTMRLGDIPYSDALSGEKGTVAPKYDTQKQVFAGILTELDEADKLFAAGTKFDGDPVYAGDITKWRKLVNTFELQVLLNLYKKTAETDLRIVERFKEIVTSRPIFTSNADNFQLVYSDKAGQRYPFYKLGNPAVIYPMISETIVGKLKSLDDNRLYYYANPSPVKVASGSAVNDPTAYIGTDPSMIYSSISSIFGTKNYSPLNSRYTELPNSEPVFLLSYPMMKFILAEAALRGWVTTSTASAYYSEGITAAMQFTASYTPDNALYHHNMKMTDAYIASYVASDKVKLAGTTEQQLSQIITQKYLATFLQAPYNAFFENRRTGYPAFPINPASNGNTPATKMPIRWLYPQKELDYNTENVKQAISSQYGGSDDVNLQMYILK
ncbi:SusD/RagB family nutrient-binding outer membrane lipoprotein [Dyadobacter psychrotolerans]|uniref:SusD/RagB family nutrient-binding outer membrane lipoprotein n=1 Tax=Dyadobacter psychrotolerans TaxID=2541721 RepID=A0A4R5DA22_9BACT|nr:SusD/RagB family nutrient-binding outer membrane lipoprotein [Dyadobacter psychrotolerans]TDE10472.1 SusD/RagB family nutrient-binding outer membrane lipoprotein [Dyadobacter psychrotolerans]